MSDGEWLEIARRLAPGFAARAAAHDAEGTFVADNYVDLRRQCVFAAGVPRELGGGGASHAGQCALLREMGRACGSTALALSMHMHLVAASVWRYRQGQPVADLLRRIAAEQLVLVSTGASDWLNSGGVAVRVAGGYSVTGRKIFGSGSPVGDLLVTSAVYEDPVEGQTVLHFPVPMAQPGVSVLDNWRALGMRGTGSNDVVLDGVFVPEAAIALRRPRGKWHPFFAVNVVVAMPLVLSAYLGIAEAARDLAVRHVENKRDDPDVWYAVGEMECALATARMAVSEMIATCAEYDFTPDIPTATDLLVRKTIAAQSVLLTVERALSVVGGAGLFASLGLERLLRDVHGAQFHPLQEKRLHRFAGRVALGLDPVD